MTIMLIGNKSDLTVSSSNWSSSSSTHTVHASTSLLSQTGAQFSQSIPCTGQRLHLCTPQPSRQQWVS